MNEFKTVQDKINKSVNEQMNQLFITSDSGDDE